MIFSVVYLIYFLPSFNFTGFVVGQQKVQDCFERKKNYENKFFVLDFSLWRKLVVAFTASWSQVRLGDYIGIIQTQVNGFLFSLTKFFLLPYDVLIFLCWGFSFPHLLTCLDFKRKQSAYWIAVWGDDSAMIPKNCDRTAFPPKVKN